jgi:hypothetical protein
VTGGRSVRTFEQRNRKRKKERRNPGIFNRPGKRSLRREIRESRPTI